MIKVTLEIQDRKDLKVILGRLVLLAHRDRKASRVFKVYRVKQVQKEILVLMDFRHLLL